MTTSAIPVAPGTLQMLLALYGYLLPILLYVLWSTLALWDLGRRETLRPLTIWSWTLGVFLLPGVGALAYLGWGGGTLPRSLKLTTVVGGVATYLLVLVIGGALGGIS